LLSNSTKPIINGGLISDTERNKIASYPQFTGELLNLGWRLIYPCPEPDQMRELCRQYNVTYVEDTPPEDVPAIDTAGVEQIIADSDYLAQIKWLIGQHDGIVCRAEKRFKSLSDPEPDFQAEIRDIISKGMRWSFTDGEDLDDQILAAVTSLCLGRERQ
jgi:hypothetical protein